VLCLLRASCRPDSNEDNSGGELGRKQTLSTTTKGGNAGLTGLRSQTIHKFKDNPSIHLSSAKQGESKDSSQEDGQGEDEGSAKANEDNQEEDESSEEEDSDDDSSEEEDSDDDSSEEEDSEDESDEGDDYEDGDGDELIAEDPGMTEWEKSLQNDYSSLENDSRAIHDLSVDDGKPGFPILLSNAQAHAIENLRLLLSNGSTAAGVLLEAYKEVILQVFISHPSGSSSVHQHTPIEAFLMSAAIFTDLSFRTSLQMSSVFSHMQYFCFFVILLECLKDKDPEQCVFQALYSKKLSLTYFID
jgi:hypothetical protein